MINNILNEIVIEVSNRCNLDCKFCMQKQNDEKKIDMDINIIKKIIIQAKEENAHGIRFTGGEPLLHKNILEAVKFSKENRLYTIMNTNGILIKDNKNVIKSLDMILLSFHDVQTSKELINKISLILSINKKLKIVIATICNKNNIKNLEKFYNIFKKDISSFSQLKKNNNLVKNDIEWILLNPIKNKNNKKPIDNKDIETLSRKIRLFNKKFELDIKISNSIPFCSTVNNINDITKTNNADNGMSRLYIKSNGNIVFDSYSSKILGSINKKTITSIWNSKKLLDIRNLKKVDNFCKQCYYLNRCKGGVNSDDLKNFNNIKPVISLIIPTFNNYQMLDVLLYSLDLQSVPKTLFEIIIVDDGSSDKTKDIYNKHKKRFQKNNLNIPHIKYIFQEDFGFRAGQARNLGAKNAEGKILIFLDDDSIPHPDFIKNHIKFQKIYDVVVGYNASYGNTKEYNKEIVKKAIKLKKLRDLPIIVEFRNDIFNSEKKSFSKTNKNLWWYFAAGNFSIKKSLFNKYKFDNDFVGWAEEDIEFGYRIHRDGIKYIFKKDCMAFNIRETKHNQQFMITREKFISTTKNQMLLLKKHNNEEVREYIKDRFRNTPNKIKKKSKIDLKKIIFIE